jgi:hypothetical protein
MSNSQIIRILRKALGFAHRPEHEAGDVLDAKAYLETEAGRWAVVLGENDAIWDAALAKAKEGPKVLIATSTGGHVAMTLVESLLAVALTLRGAQVHLLLCDHLLPGCLQAMLAFTPDLKEFVENGPQQHLCRSCYGPSNTLYQSLGLPVHRYSDFITSEELLTAQQLSSDTPLESISTYRVDSLAVGEHALAGALRFFAKGNLTGEAYAGPVLRRYFDASLRTVFITRRLLQIHDFTSICFHHGIYVPQGLIGEVARRQGVRVVNWNPAYRKQCFIFSHHDTYHHTLLDEPTANWEAMDWTIERESEILSYLKSRWQGTRDWIWFHEKPEEELGVIAAELGLDFSRPWIGMLTNVMWDAQLHYRANAFPNMLDWVLQTIRYFAERPELQLIIRVHPAEIRGTLPSRQPIMAEIQREIPILPKNIFLIAPESQVSTYAVMSRCNAVVIYGTKMGVELTSMGVPTIVAGEAWIRNKGITLDASSPKEYFSLLDRLPLNERLGQAMLERARKYAYHFFFRRMIPLSFLFPSTNNRHLTPYELQNRTIDQLRAGQDLALDIICDGILKGTEFIYPAEQVASGTVRALEATVS